ncbi:MAG TPA: hypothetical protein DIC25_00215 [Weissella cibaria]|nr:hypothetical protein [Weissella cibaria]
MTKYVIDLPEGVKFIVGKGYVMLSEKELLRIPVENLQEYIAPTVAENAPVEKRVIELPADVIADLNEYKRARNSFNLFITTVGNSIPYFEYGLRLEDLSDWYLHPKLIEFVPKKEPMFVVEVDRHEYIYASFIGSAIGKKTVDFWKIPQEVTEEEADELVAGLTALNARKVKVDE